MGSGDVTGKGKTAIVMVGIVFVFIPVAMASTIPKVNDFGGNVDNSAVPCPKKWIMESYFEKFDNLNDSHFHYFKVDSLAQCLCDVRHGAQTMEPTLSGLDRRIVGEGSHRQLYSSIRISVDPSVHSCEFLIIERLPSGIFADPFELQHLLQRNLFIDAAVFGDTDLERPTVHSNRTVVEIHVDIGRGGMSRNKHGVEIDFHIPLHIRYPPLHESGYVKVVFGQPDVITRCSFDGMLTDQQCLSVVAPENAEWNLSSVDWEVPAGIETHTGVVSAVTFLSAALSALIIVLASIFHSDAVRTRL